MEGSLQLRMLTHALSLKNETSFRGHLVIRLQPVQNCKVAICRGAKPHYAHGESSFVVLNREEHELAIANRLHGRLGYRRSNSAVGGALDVNVHLEAQAFAGIGD